MANQSMMRLYNVLEQLIDRSVGIIHDVEELPREAGAPALFYYYARSCNTKAFCGQANFGDGGGASLDRSIALAKAVGEAVERYCSAIYDRHELPLHSFNSAPFDCVRPEDFALYTAKQYLELSFPFLPFTRNSLLRWVPATEPLTNNVYYVPASMIYVPYLYDEDAGEVPICQPISTGLACHGSAEEAAISALCEVIERDAFTISWQARLTRTRIAIETLSDRNRELIGRLESNGSRITVVNMTMDSGIPTIFAAASSTSEEAPAFVCAAATHLDPEQAARKCLEEVAHTRVLAQALKAGMPAPLSAESIIDQDSHIRFYAERSNATFADFLLASPSQMDFNEIPNLSTTNPSRDLTVLIERIDKIGHQVLLTDLTTSDVRQLGLTVIRAVIPGFHPLVLGHRIRALGGTRLWSIPQKLGHKGVSASEAESVPPHPYP